MRVKFSSLVYPLSFKIKISDIQTNLDAYTKKNFKRSEVPDFMKQKYPQYSWSLGSLDRRMWHFDVRYVNKYDDFAAAVHAAVQEELRGPG